MRGLGLILVSLIDFHEAERYSGLASGFFGEKRKKSNLRKEKIRMTFEKKKRVGYLASSCGLCL